MPKVAALVVVIPLLSLCGCGGGGGGGGTVGSGGPPPPTQMIAAAGPPNVESLVMDSGPAGLNTTSINTAFVTVKICEPNNPTVCQLVDHVEVDTGSVGLRILSSVLTSVTLPTVPSGPNAECLTFADGSSWGSLATANIELPTSTEAVSGLTVQIIGDLPAGSIPSACSGTAENTIAAFGANGILGVGPYINDCQSTVPCTPPGPGQSAPAAYYTCPTPTTSTSVCTATSATLAEQVPNPVVKFARDNNGVILELPAVSDGGAPGPTNAVLVFGIGTESNNNLGTATVLTLPSSGSLGAQFGATAAVTSAFLDSGSNGNFFPDSSLTTCADLMNQFYCPANAPIAESAQLAGANGASVAADFKVGNADTMFANAAFHAFPDLAGPPSTGGGTSLSSTLDLGMPFFYGRNMFTGFETNSVGPYYAY